MLVTVMLLSDHRSIFKSGYYPEKISEFVLFCLIVVLFILNFSLEQLELLLENPNHWEALLQSSPLK
ncbi:hypothetical protein ABFG93_05695 [Pseudalkalibacillus hwajinpoensis]|uniref:hypothetical protein n=1 Tax=Guptibacillus hwajinpoensis TaxID=208199 RepID=UPI00325B1DAA